MSCKPGCKINKLTICILQKFLALRGKSWAGLGGVCPGTKKNIEFSGTEKYTKKMEYIAEVAETE